MAVPKKKTSKARQGMRRSQDRISLPPLVYCPECQSPKLAHHICPTCGKYDGRQEIEVKSKSRRR